MFPVRQEREMVLEKVSQGHFEMELRISAFAMTEPVPAIDPLFRIDFQTRNTAAGIPVVAFRYGERGQCCVWVNQNVFEVESMSRWVGDSIALNMEEYPVAKDEFYTELHVEGYTTYRDSKPTQIYIEGRLKKEGYPFSARIFYVPTGSK